MGFSCSCNVFITSSFRKRSVGGKQRYMKPAFCMFGTIVTGIEFLQYMVQYVVLVQLRLVLGPL
jgi:hypothetical protein